MEPQTGTESGLVGNLAGGHSTSDEAIRRQQPPVPANTKMVVVCRICLATRPQMISIHSSVPEYEQKTLYAMLLSVCLPLNQRETVQGFPEQICRNCKWKLLSAYDLYETTLASDEQLRAQRRPSLVGQRKVPFKVAGGTIEVKTVNEPSLVTPDESNDGPIRVKEEIPDEQYETVGAEHDDSANASGEMILTEASVAIHAEVSMLHSDGKLHEEDEDLSLLEVSKDEDPEPLEAFFIEHYQVDAISGNHVCGLCKQEFPYKSQCRMHIVQKHNPAKPFKCEICLCTLTSHLRLVRHKIVAHGPGMIKREDVIESPNDTTGETSYTCPICHKEFSSSVRFKRHKNVHVVHNRPFKCEICLYRFTTKPQLTQHAKVHETKPSPGLSPGGSEVGEYPCDRCEEVFPGKRALTMHLKKAHQVYRVPGGPRPDDREKSEYVCIICKETFARETVLNTHMKMHELLAAEKEKEHRLDLERLVKQELQQQMLLNVPPLPPLSPEVIDRSSCVLEPFTLGLVPVAKPGSGSNNNDNSSINNNGPPQAAIGTDGGPGVSSGKRKLSMPPAPPSDMVYVCPVCDMEFDEREPLKKHQKEQHSRLQVGIVSSKHDDTDRPGSSPFGKKLPRLTPMPGLKMRLLNDSRKANNNKILPNRMPSDYTGEDHSPAHDEMPDDDSQMLLPIDDVPARTERRSAPAAAGSPGGGAGTESSQFQCTLCRKTFPYNCYLTMHMRKNHDESKPYGCKVCHYRFGYRGTLLRHQLIHSSQHVQPGGHGSIIFKCRICSAKFLELRQLNTHLKTHRKVVEEPGANRRVQLIRCHECPQIFSDRDQLRQHMVKEHQDSVDDDLYEEADQSLLLDSSSSSLNVDGRGTGSPLTDLRLNSEQSKDDGDDSFMNDLSIIKMEPNFD